MGAMKDIAVEAQEAATRLLGAEYDNPLDMLAALYAAGFESGVKRGREVEEAFQTETLRPWLVELVGGSLTGSVTLGRYQSEFDAQAVASARSALKGATIVVRPERDGFAA